LQLFSIIHTRCKERLSGGQGREVKKTRLTIRKRQQDQSKDQEEIDQKGVIDLPVISSQKAFLG